MPLLLEFHKALERLRIAEAQLENADPLFREVAEQRVIDETMYINALIAEAKGHSRPLTWDDVRAKQREVVMV